MAMVMFTFESSKYILLWLRISPSTHIPDSYSHEVIGHSSGKLHFVGGLKNNNLVWHPGGLV